MNEIPPAITEILMDEELENIRNRTGWAIGVVVQDDNGTEQRRIEDAVIELLNGAGGAGAFGGVKFLATEGGSLTEADAFATEEAYRESSQSEGWYVAEWTDPGNPNYSQPAPSR